MTPIEEDAGCLKALPAYNFIYINSFSPLQVLKFQQSNYVYTFISSPIAKSTLPPNFHTSFPNIRIYINIYNGWFTLFDRMDYGNSEVY